jgi:hypothetical protein
MKERLKVTGIDVAFPNGQTEKVWFQSLTYGERKRIVMSRLKKTGHVDANGQETRAVDPEENIDMMLELIAATVVKSDEDRAKVFSKKELMDEVDPEITDTYIKAFNENVGVFGPEALRKQKEKTAAEAEGKDVDEENPSKPKT